jgi:hypothetical protein
MPFPSKSAANIVFEDIVGSTGDARERIDQPSADRSTAVRAGERKPKRAAGRNPLRAAWTKGSKKRGSAVGN